MIEAEVIEMTQHESTPGELLEHWQKQHKLDDASTAKLLEVAEPHDVGWWRTRGAKSAACKLALRILLSLPDAVIEQAAKLARQPKAKVALAQPDKPKAVKRQRKPKP
jgi:hypothetical protein